MSDWREIPRFSKYEVSELAEIRNRQTRRHLSPFVDKSGYRMVSLMPDEPRAGKRLQQNVPLHRLVCLAFHGLPPSPQHEVAHNDGVRLNCVPSNLRWATRKENHADKHRHGTRQVGERIGNAVLTATQVAEIRRRHAHGRALGASNGNRLRVPNGLLGEIAAAVGVTYNDVRRAVWSPWWKEVQ